jgi:hypothetical protein
MVTKEILKEYVEVSYLEKIREYIFRKLSYEVNP